MENYFDKPGLDLNTMLGQLHADILEEYLGRPLELDDTPYIIQCHITTYFAPIQTYKLYFKKVLIGYISYGHVPIVKDFQSIARIFKVQYISPHQYN